MSTFGERLKKEREIKGISQQELAKRLNLSQSTIAYYELDKKQPPHATLNKIASFFDISIDYLLGRTKQPVSQPSVQDEKIDYVVKAAGEPGTDERRKFALKLVEELQKLPVEKQMSLYNFIKDMQKE